MTIAQLKAEDQSLPIWALNGSAMSAVGQAGDVHVPIPKINGTKVDALYLPQTFLPQCITDQIPRDQLLGSSEFLNAVNSLLVIPVTAAYAQLIMSRAGAKEETERLAAQKRHVREATAARTIQQGGAEIYSTSEIADAQERAVESTPKTLPVSFTMYAQSLTTKTDIEAMNSLRSRGVVRRAEVKHLIRVLHDKPKTLAMLQAKLVRKS